MVLMRRRRASDASLVIVESSESIVVSSSGVWQTGVEGGGWSTNFLVELADWALAALAGAELSMAIFADFEKDGMCISKS
jgi:hypothetical protein